MTKDANQRGCILLLMWLLLATPMAIWSGYVLSILWGWFIVPVFDVPQLPIPTAIGIGIVCGYLCKADGRYDKDSNPEETFAYSVGIGLFKPAMALLFGWIVTLFM